MDRVDEAYEACRMMIWRLVVNPQVLVVLQPLHMNVHCTRV